MLPWYLFHHFLQLLMPKAATQFEIKSSSYSCDPGRGPNFRNEIATNFTPANVDYIFMDEFMTHNKWASRHLAPKNLQIYGFSRERSRVNRMWY